MRAIRAAKLERLHAKPFVTSFDGHVETITQICKVRNKLPQIISGLSLNHTNLLLYVFVCDITLLSKNKTSHFFFLRRVPITQNRNKKNKKIIKK